MNGRIYLTKQNKVDKVLILKDEFDSLIKKKEDYDQLLDKYNELRENVKKLMDGKFFLSGAIDCKCDICHVTLGSKTAFNYHNKSKKHLARIEAMALNNFLHDEIEESDND
jgi:hypothetical protein